MKKYLLLVRIALLATLTLVVACPNDDVMCTRCVDTLCDDEPGPCACGCAPGIRKNIDGEERICTGSCWKRIDEIAECKNVMPEEPVVCADDVEKSCETECGCAACETSLARNGIEYSCSIWGCLNEK